MFSIDHPRYQILVTDDGSRTLIDPETRVAFHSGCGAAAETSHVYLEGSGVAQRLADRHPTRVLEIGVGLGLGLLMTVDQAISRQSSLQYVGIERDWLDARWIEPLGYDREIRTPNLMDQYTQFRTNSGNQTRCHWQPTSGVEVTVHCRPFDDVIDDITGPFDAIYFDPFAPATNPEMWTESVFWSLAKKSIEPTRLVTYCVNRKIRDSMAAAGWTCHRVPGPDGGKREVLIATRTSSLSSATLISQ